MPFARLQGYSLEWSFVRSTRVTGSRHAMCEAPGLLARVSFVRDTRVTGSSHASYGALWLLAQVTHHAGLQGYLLKPNLILSSRINGASHAFCGAHRLLARVSCCSDSLNPLDAGRRYTGFPQASKRRQTPVYRACANFSTSPTPGIPGLCKLISLARHRYTGFIF